MCFGESDYIRMSALGNPRECGRRVVDSPHTAPIRTSLLVVLRTPRSSWSPASGRAGVGLGESFEGCVSSTAWGWWKVTL